MRYTGISTMQWPGMVSVYAVLGSHPRVTTTGAHQVGIDFSGHRGLVREVAGRVRRHDAEPGAVYVTGNSPITWLEVTDPTEALEIYPDRALLDRLAGRDADLRPSFAVHDGVVFAVASRLRRAHLTAGALTDAEASTLAHLLVQHLLRRYGTGSPPRRRPAGGLRPGAVDVVAEYVHAHLADEITLDALAAAVNLSTYHFARSFRATTGLTPHAFVTEHRLMVARDRLLRGDASVAAIGLSVGFSNISHFRRLFRRRYGLTAAALRRASAALWGAEGLWRALTMMGRDELAWQRCPTDSVGFEWYVFPMEGVVDQAGRIVLPKFIRDALGLLPGTKVDISPYGAGVQVVPAGRTARLVEEDGVLVSSGETPVDDDVLFGLIDGGRR